MRILTGIQPSGNLHLGNYFGTLKSMLDSHEDMFIFIADYHAMTSNQNGQILKENKLKIAAAFMALGIDDSYTFWMQSDVKEVLELYWILSHHTPLGLLERAHSYKDKIAKGINASHGLFSYPVLMAADILLYEPHFVPVGKDQIQHLEICKDIAMKFNHTYGDIFKIPSAKIEANLAIIPGTNGEKMSKSYKNTIDIFAPEKELKKQIQSIITDSTPLNEPKDYMSCNIFKIASLFLDSDGKKELIARYKSGNEGYGHFKLYLFDLIIDYFKDARQKYIKLLEKPNDILDILDTGASKARKIAQNKLSQIYDKIGL